MKRIEIEYNYEVNYNEINKNNIINNNKQLKRINSKENNICDMIEDDKNKINNNYDNKEININKEYKLIEDIEEIYYNNDGLEIIVNLNLFNFKKIKFNEIKLSKKLIKYKKDVFITNNNKIININEYINNNNSNIKIHILLNNKIINHLTNQTININYSITNNLIKYKFFN